MTVLAIAAAALALDIALGVRLGILVVERLALRPF